MHHASPDAEFGPGLELGLGSLKAKVLDGPSESPRSCLEVKTWGKEKQHWITRPEGLRLKRRRMKAISDKDASCRTSGRKENKKRMSQIPGGVAARNQVQKNRREGAELEVTTDRHTKKDKG